MKQNEKHIYSESSLSFECISISTIRAILKTKRYSDANDLMLLLMRQAVDWVWLKVVLNHALFVYRLLLSSISSLLESKLYRAIM